MHLLHFGLLSSHYGRGLVEVFAGLEKVAIYLDSAKLAVSAALPRLFVCPTFTIDVFFW
jgi:hypothetical protein